MKQTQKTKAMTNENSQTVFRLENGNIITGMVNVPYSYNYYYNKTSKEIIIYDKQNPNSGKLKNQNS